VAGCHQANSHRLRRWLCFDTHFILITTMLGNRIWTATAPPLREADALFGPASGQDK
jgi:hypothetical protein